MAYKKLRTFLAEPLGTRRRCAYCSDSRAADVEHYWPKKPFPQKAFTFENYLYICTECNRKKGDRFPFDDYGLPSLINPMFDDPWDVLFFAPATGYIAARIIEVQNDGTLLRSERGERTLEILGSILNSTPLLEGRKESWADVVAATRSWLSGTQPVPKSQIDMFGLKDTYGLGEFLLNREGKEQPEIRAMRQSWPQRWQLLRDLPRS